LWGSLPLLSRAVLSINTGKSEILVQEFLTNADPGFLFSKLDSAAQMAVLRIDEYSPLLKLPELISKP
jgi:hypothetical protein